MLTARRRHRARGEGQALAEFSLVAAIFFLMLFGVIQLGLIMAAQNGLVNGVRDSTRRAATYRVNDQSFDGGVTFNAICSGVRTELINRLTKEVPAFAAARLPASNIQIQYEWVPDPTSGEYSLIASVTATYNNPIYVPLVGLVLHPSDPGSFPLTASEQMRVENPALKPIDTSTHTCT